MKRIICLFVFTSFILSLDAQNEVGTYFLKGLDQSASLNPAFDADSKWVISLPTLYVNSMQRGLTIGNFLSGNFLELLSNNRNQIIGGAEVSILKISYKRDNIRYRFAHNYKAFGDVHFSDPLAELIFKGNTSLIGGRISSSPYLNFNVYSETVLGFTYTSHFSVGINLKLLNGIQNVTSEDSNLELSVNEDIYQLQGSGDILLNSTFPIDITNSDTSGKIQIDPFPNNFGFGIDVGFSYKNGPFTYSASVIDLGMITWKDNVHNYKASGTFAFDGLDINQILDGNTNVLDTIIGSSNFESQNMPYRKYVPAKFYFNVDYQLNSKYSLGGLLYLHKSQSLYTTIFAVNAFRNFNNKHQFGVQYGITSSNLANIGFNGYTTLGPVRIFGVFDNVIGFLNPLGSKFINGRVGVNIIFGNMKKAVAKV